MNLANTYKLMQHKQLQEAAKYPHDMFDPETGEKEVANNEAEHKALAAKGYTHEKPEAKDEKDLDESFEALVALDEAKKVQVSVELWNGKKMKKSFTTQSAAEKFIKKMQDEEDVRGYNMFAEGLDEAFEALVALDEAANWIDGTKYQKEKKKKGFNKDDWEWNSSKQLYKRVNEEVALDEAFKRIPGNMINGELPRAAKDLESVIKGLKAGNDFDDKAFNKVLAALNNVKKSAKSFKSADDLTTPYQYRGVNESVALDEAYQQFTDKTPNWGEDQALTFGRKKGYKEVAVMSDTNKKHPMVLFALDSADKKYIKGSNVKSGETVFRYATKISIAGDIFPLVKVNIAKGIYYNLTQESSEGTIEDAKFENKGVKLKFFRSLEGAIKESVELDEAKFGDNDLVHIAKANVRAPNNAKTDKIIGYSKALKNPNMFPDPITGANAIMRIADAKKKGFKIESAELNEDHFMVQYYDKKGKADTTKFSKFDDEQKAKNYLDRANKAEKEGEYKMFKVKGKMESLEEATAAKKVYTKKVGQSTVNVYQYSDKRMVAMFTSKGFGETSYGIKKLDKKAIDGAVKHFDDNKGLLGDSLDTIEESVSNPNFFGTQPNYGSSDSLLAAVNAVVTGQAETVEVSVESQNEVIEQGVEELGEAFSSFAVPIPAQTLSGKKIGGGKTPIVVKARTAREAIQKAAKQLGVDFKMLKTGKVMKEDASNDKSDDGEGLDKADPKAAKKKFKDRKDKDIDNDGDVDSSDEFLHKKRKAISKAISKDESKEKDDKKKDKKADVVDTSPSLDEGLKNPYKGKSSADLKRKLSSFESQLQDLIQKSKGRQRKEIEGEIRDMETKVQQVRSALKESYGLNEATFKSKYGSRWEAVMEATIKRLAEQQELNEKFTLLKDKDIAPLVLALKDNISVELKDPKNNNLLVTMQTTDDGVQVKYKTGRNTKVGTEKSPMPAIKSAVKFLKAKELAFREL